MRLLSSRTIGQADFVQLGHLKLPGNLALRLISEAMNLLEIHLLHRDHCEFLFAAITASSDMSPPA